MEKIPPSTNGDRTQTKTVSPILPGATIGLLGGGQLGRMFALAARRMGYRVHTFDPLPDSPTGQISDREFNFPYDDHTALEQFAKSVDVITYEFENIPIATLDHLSKFAMLRPNRQILHIAQNRLREKEFLQQNRFPIAPFQLVKNEGELKTAVEKIGVPCVLKTADFGYDGKGQKKIVSQDEDFSAIWKNLNAPLGVVEKWIDFEAELSVIVARGGDGEMKCFPVAHNVHENHILAVSTVPAPFDSSISKEAYTLAETLAQKLDLIGILAVEMFLTKEGKLLINEMAPRPHNSGHYSFDACVTSQFEQQLRAVCGLPLGETDLLKPVLMHNLLGDLWSRGTPAWPELLRLPGLKLHLYGKSEARKGRKMGHYCVLADSIEAAREIDGKAQVLLMKQAK